MQMLAAHASRDTTVATGFWVSAAVFALLAVFCVLSAIRADPASALLEAREGRVVVDRKVEHAVADIQRVHVAQRRVPAPEAAAKFGKLAGRGEETTALFDVVATVGTRGEVLATYATADRAILAQAALADALGHAPRATANVRIAVDAPPGRPGVDALDAEADDGAERGRSLGTHGGGNDGAR